MENKMLKRRLFAAGKRCANWFVNTQIVDMGSADNGRYCSEIVTRTMKYPIGPSIAWTTGTTVMAMLMAYKRTENEKYLESVKEAGSFLKSLQILDSRTAKNFGMMREINPQCEWCHPRDALSGAWGMLHIGREFKDDEYVDRAVLFGKWFAKYAVKGNYPGWSFYTDDRPTFWQLGSFHGGSPLFFMDLYEKTWDDYWLKKVALPILDTYIKTFVKKDGSIRIVVDRKTGRDLTNKDDDKIPHGWKHMHMFNDDFTSMALMRAFHITGKEVYYDTAKRFLDWILKQENRNGGFGKPSVPSGNALLISELLDMAAISGEGKYEDAAMRAAGGLLDWQEMDNKDKRVYGGVYGVAKGYTYKNKHTINIRTASYALAAYFKAEGKMDYEHYTA